MKQIRNNKIITPQVLKVRSNQIKKPGVPKNKIVLIDNKQLQLHFHKDTHYHMTKSRPPRYNKMTTSKECLVCGTSKRMAHNQNFCSVDCGNAYRRYRRNKIQEEMWLQHMRNQPQQNVAWWQVWK